MCPLFRHFVLVEQDGPETAMWPPLIAGDAGKSSISVDCVPRTAFCSCGQKQHLLEFVVASATVPLLCASGGTAPTALRTVTLCVLACPCGQHGAQRDCHPVFICE